MKCRFCDNTIPDGSIFCNLCGEKQIRTRKKKDEVKVPKPRLLKSGRYIIELRAEGQSKTFVSPDDAIEWAKAVRAENAAVKSTNTITTGKAIDAFVSANGNTLSPSTLKGYKSVRENAFKDAMDVPLDRVDWQAQINLYAANHKPKTVSNAWHVITKVMKLNNVPIPMVNLSKAVKTEHNFLDYKQVKQFLTAIYDQPCELAALLALHSLRRSEITALTFGKVNILRSEITVKGSTVYDMDGKLVSKDANKNITSTRTVPIMISRLTVLLKERMKECPDNMKLADFPVVKFMPNTAYVQINRVCRRNNLPEIGIHGLRHSFCSLAYYLKWDVKTTMRVGGWSTPKVPQEIYTHLADSAVNSSIRTMKMFYKNASFTNEIRTTKKE